MNFTDLLNACQSPQSKITQVTASSLELLPQANPGSVFVAIRGEKFDSHQLIDAVLAKGVFAVVGEVSHSDPRYVQVANSRQALASLACAHFGNPSRAMCVLGVTGTSGKTSLTYILEAMFLAAGQNVGVIGTVNIRYAGKVFPATHTTPDALALQKIFSEMKQSGVQTVIMEVSSHALDQYRVFGTAWDGAIFLNLSPEHLDYHPSMEAYFEAKALLFTREFESSRRQGKNPIAVIHSTDPFGKRLIEKLKPESNTVVQTYGGDSRSEAPEEVRAWIQNSHLVGEFNRQNVWAAGLLARSQGVTNEQIQEGLRQLTGIPGRLERVVGKKPVSVFVDYAHKPDALEKVLQTLREETTRNLIVVFGCGGDRDREKRPLMGEIAARLSDQVWITSDNPRTEDPQAIIQEILNGVPLEKKSSGSIHVESDRERAISQAISEALPGDCVVIAGKGHETTQVLGTEKRPFDDRKIAKKYLDIK